MNSAGWGLSIFGTLLFLAGATFSFQGAGYLGGSSMTGSSFWLYAGVVIAILGLVMVVGALVIGSRPKKTSAATAPPAA